MRIKTYQKFLESISGTELIGSLGPAMGSQKLSNTISSADTNVVYDEATDKFYSEDEYYDLYNKYIEKGGTPLFGGLNKENLKKVLDC